MRSLSCILGFHKFEDEVRTIGTSATLFRHCLRCNKRPQYQRDTDLFWYNCGKGFDWQSFLEFKKWMKKHSNLI